jgi:uncharacterized protein (UPF0335 family)
MEPENIVHQILEHLERLEHEIEELREQLRYLRH